MLNYPKKVPISYSQNDKSDKSFKIIYPGTLSHQQGVDLLIKAVFLLREKIPGINLDIYSSSYSRGYKDDLLLLIKRLNLNEIVRFHEAIPPEELRQKIYMSDLGVAPKRRGIFLDEAFSTKIFDFFAAGIPTVVSKTPVEEYYFNDHKVKFFKSEDVDSLAEAIYILFKSPEQREVLVSNAKEFLNGNYWDDKKRVYLDKITQITTQSST